MTSTSAIPAARPQQRRSRSATGRPRPTAAPTSPARAAREATRLADELAALHRDLAAAAVTGDPELRAAWYRLEDAARSCRRAAEELRPDRG